MQTSATAARPAPAERAVPEAGPATPLLDWLRVFARPYRGQFAALVGINLGSALAIFAELEILRALTVVLSRDAGPPSAACSWLGWIRDGFPVEGGPCAGRLPGMLLAVYAGTVVLQASLDLWGLAVNARMSQRARRDVERELLRNLLGQDDSFFRKRAPAEILNRLGGDLQRVGARRQMVVQAVATALAVVAIGCVLVAQSPVAAAVGFGLSLAGVAASQPLLGRLQRLDQAMSEADDRVKAGLEDALQGVAEIQVSGLAARTLDGFGRRQAARDALMVRNADLNNINNASQKTTFSFGFISILALFVVTDLFGPASGGGTERAALIVVLISSLPQLYFRLGELTLILSQFQVSSTSIGRLARYAAPPAAAAERPGRALPAGSAPEGIALRGVRYSFGGDGPALGGPGGIDCDIPARGMIGIVGPAGAGKSTLMRLILGRHRPVAGAIVYPAGPAGGRFSYLPQRPIIFDATLRENLLIAAEGRDGAFAARRGALEALGLLDLLRRKGLDGLPGPGAGAIGDVASLRASFSAALAGEAGLALRPLRPGRPTPRQFVAESLAGCAVDQAAFARRLVSIESREPILRLAATDEGRALAAVGAGVVRATAPLLAQCGDPESYDRVTGVALEPEVWLLRSRALEAAAAPRAGAGGPAPPLLIAVGLSARVEEVDGLPAAPGPEAAAALRCLLDGLSAPIDADALNPLLPWRENLVFGAPEAGNANRLALADRTLVAALRGSPADGPVLEAGLDAPAGRAGGRLSGGQGQLLAIGRALLNPAPFVVLDEPSSALHPELRAALAAVLRAEARSRSVVLVTHDMALARACDRVLFVRDGAVAAEGAWADLAGRDPAFRAWAGEGAGA